MKTLEKKRTFSKKPTKKNHKVQKNREVIAEPDTNKVNIDEIQAGSKIEADLKKLKNQQLEEEKIFKQTLIRKNDNEKIICLSCDGSETSKQAFEIAALEFLPRIENSILACTYIFNSRKDEKFNWRYQKQTIIEYYKNKLREKKLDKDKKGYLIIEDKNPDDKQEIEQVYQIARKNGCEGFIVGYNGLKGPTLKRDNIALGLHYLLSESTVPTFIMKDKLLRGEKNEGYNWLIVLDRSVSNCMKILAIICFCKCIGTEHENRLGPAHNYEDRGIDTSCHDYYVLKQDAWRDDDRSNSNFVPNGVSDCIDLQLWNVNKNRYYDRCCYVRFQVNGQMHAGCVGLYQDQLIDVTETIKKMENGDSNIWTNQAYNSKIYQLDCGSSYLKFISLIIFILLGLFL